MHVLTDWCPVAVKKVLRSVFEDVPVCSGMFL